MTIKTKSNEILIIKVEHDLHNMIFGYDQYGRYLRLRKDRFEIIQ